MMPTIRAQEAGPEYPGTRRRNAALRAEYLVRFEKAGMTAAAFCREHGLEKQTFYNWRQKARRAGGGQVRRTPQFAEVTVTANGPSQPEGAAIRVQLVGGAALEVRAGTDPLWLAQVLREVGALG